MALLEGEVVTPPYNHVMCGRQGEDVVAGIRTPYPISTLRQAMPDAHAQLLANCTRLERAYGDMMDVEFTVQDGTLYMLQCRSGKRTGWGAVTIAYDMVAEGLIRWGGVCVCACVCLCVGSLH